MDKKDENSNRYTISNECFDIEFLYIQPAAGSTFEDVQPEVCLSSFYNISYIISRIYHGMTLMPLFCSIPLMI